jgi:hypothetical protein
MLTTPRVALVKPDPPSLEMFKGDTFRSHMKHPYRQTRQVFLLRRSGEAEERWEAFVYFTFDTTNAKGVERTATGSLWSLRLSARVKQGVEKEDEVVELPSGATVRIVRCPRNIKHLLKHPKQQVAHLFSTNDLASCSSFTFGQRSGTYIERTVMGLCKTRYNEHCTRRASAEDLYNLALVSPRACPYMLAAVLSGEGNDTRFAYEIPDGLSKEERKLHKEEALLGVRARLRAEVTPEQFKKAYLAWLALNHTLPRDLEPRTLKCEVSDKLLMLPEDLPAWNQLAPLLFVLATSKHMQDNPENLFVLATCVDAFIAEITPDDARYGIKPPDGQDLTWTRTPAGLEWIVALVETHAPSQHAHVAYIAEQTRYSRESGSPEVRAAHDGIVFTMLTEAINRYRLQGILGLAKNIALHTFVGSELGGINLTEGVRAMIKDFLGRHGIPDFWLHSCKLARDESRLDPFDIIDAIGVKSA